MGEQQRRLWALDEEAHGAPGSDPALPERIRQLLAEQPYAVLSTQGGGQPYASLVAFAVSPALDAAVFATPRNTRKFRLLSECDRVALLVDNRCVHPQAMMEVEAVTATGRAMQVVAGPEFERWSALLLAKHPHLAPFVRSPSVALFKIDIVRYFHVVRFQEVTQWRPGA
jgi:nitroimidazol reductase NimA-like FMN-containing flavoprotein (pyridoxamine 5'-phosphate oxidase superfamily)